MTEEETTCRHCGLPVPGRRRGGCGPWFCCLGCNLVHRLALPATAEGEQRGVPSTLLLRLGLGIFLTLNIMVASWLSYSREIFGADALARGVDAILPGLFSYLALFLCTLVVALLSLPLLGEAMPFTPPPQNGRRRPGLPLPDRINAQTLIVLGVWAAYLLSAIHTVRGEGPLYYDTAALILVIVTLGSYLEATAKRRAAASARRLLSALPNRIQVLRAGTRSDLPAEEVRPGDLVMVRAGETVPVDGEVVEGRSRVNEASLTGESRWRSVRAGDRLLAGVQTLDGQLCLRAEQVGADTVLALMERSLRQARAGRPPIQRLADRAAAVFVPTVVLLALAAFGYRAWHGLPGEGLLTGLAVLLISCPCALGLAAPLACWHGLRRAAEGGILIDSAATLERAAAIERIFFDKTGTLTRPELAIEKITVAPGFETRQAVASAAGLESASLHPIARALLEVAARLRIEPPIAELATAVPGLGIEGKIGGQQWQLGGVHWVARKGLADQPLARQAEETGDSAVFLMQGEELRARFDLAEELRPGTVGAIADLRRMGVEVGILSGDRQGPTHRVAERLGLEAIGGLLPQDKVRWLSAARRSGGVLAMVGDGINDAPVLAAADVGITVGSASDLARRSGHVHLLSEHPDRIPTLLRIARDTRRRIRANLVFSFGFNSLGILLALAGWLTPVFAAVAMLLSSLTVIRISSHAGRAAVDGLGEAP